jgi:MFS family permease
MLPSERRAAVTLASIYGLRMLGLFMILPVFALYAEQLQGVTPTLVGLAIGAYGLTQALLGIPVGALSDRVGRKPVIVAGLLVFALGSAVAAMADSIWGVIIGRAIQGAGAIAAVLMALATDLTREEVRLRTMAMIGVTIGMSFALSLILGPLLDRWIGVPGIFWVIAALALVAIVVLYTAVPPEPREHVRAVAPGQFREVLADTQLLRLNFGVLVLHMILTALFVALPHALRDNAGLDAQHHWYVYLPVMVLAMLLMIPFVIVAEKKKQIKPVFVLAILVASAAQLALVWSHTSLAMVVVTLLVFFTAFNVLEATMPSLVAKISPPDRKGTAMGIFSTAQFLGAFIGGAAGGWVSSHFGLQGVFTFCALGALLWFGVAVTMTPPQARRANPEAEKVIGRGGEVWPEG